MKSTVWSFNKNKRPYTKELDRYYRVNNKQQLQKLVYDLLDLNIDGVIYPYELSFPVTLKLENGFGLQLVEAKQKDLEEDLAKLLNTIELIEK